MTAWLKHQAGLSAGAAGSMVRTAKALRSLPVTTAAWSSGALSSGQVQAVLANVPERHLDRFAGHEAAVVPTLEELSVQETALGLAMSADADGESRAPAERRADALVDLCRWFLDHQDVTRARRNRPHPNVVLDLDALETGSGGELTGVGFLDAAALRRLLCDAGVHRVLVEGGSSILNDGHETRTVSTALWKALVLHDRHCRHPG